MTVNKVNQDYSEALAPSFFIEHEFNQQEADEAVNEFLAIRKKIKVVGKKYGAVASVRELRDE